jgi:hypothetical protein
LFGQEILIPELKKPSNIVEISLHSQPPSRIIRTTAYKIPLALMAKGFCRFVGMERSILGSEKSLNNVECLFHSQPSSRIIRTTADYFPESAVDDLIVSHEFRGNTQRGF